jgi:hypothetical protein
MACGVTKLSSRGHLDQLDQVGRLRLPLRLADFSRRGFRVDRPAKRVALENHARHFLAGFNLAVVRWRDPHPALGAVTAYERGFAYEGAAMHAALRDVLTGGRTDALSRLLAGPGSRYVHLIHVGYGWAFTPLRLPLPVPRPATPLLTWCADEREIDTLVESSAGHWPHFGQGVLFAAAARCRAGIVPPHTERICHQLFGKSPREVSTWTDEAASGLTQSSDVSAYSEWRSRLRARIARRK